MNKLLLPIKNHALTQPDHPALLTITGDTITYRQLIHRINGFAASITKATSIGARIGIVLPSDEKAALSFLSVTACGVAAPLNPKLTRDELIKLIDLLHLQCILTTSDPAFQHAVLAAETCRIPCLFWEELVQQFVPETMELPDNRPDDATLLLLHTSGTTAAPKIVPLSANNLAASSRNITHTLQIQPSDRCLNVMPLFHIHGLMAGLMASLSAGASVICSPGYHGVHFFEWLKDLQPTWYTAVPTIHQAVLERVKQNQQLIKGHRLRLVRSSSSSLSPQTFHEMEEFFHVPMIEAYGMTEAAHQIASNPLPPAMRKPGSVGQPGGPEIAIADAQAPVLLDRQQRGEIVIRGENVINGYENNPQANLKNFFDGWFRTGDEGFFDNDGYLCISGRIKELINRGGEKITPREIDEAILNYPNVQQAVCFAIPHPQYGEVVGAVIKTNDPNMTQKQVQDYLQDKLADYKIPVVIKFVDSIPTGPTGKIQRIFLAQALSLQDVFTKNSPGHQDEQFSEAYYNKMKAIWCAVFKQEIFDINTPFLDMGGDSLLAAELIMRINENFGVQLAIQDLFEQNTIHKLLQKIDPEKKYK